MARPVRILIPDGWYHVFGRGWERRPIFRDDRDRTRFLELLGELHEVCRFVIHAYALCHSSARRRWRYSRKSLPMSGRSRAYSTEAFR